MAVARRKRSGAADGDGGDDGSGGDRTESSSLSSIHDMAFPNLCARYAIEHQIGDGGQGRVFQVRRLSDGRRFACKSVRVEESRELDLVRQEVAVMRLIQTSGAATRSTEDEIHGFRPRRHGSDRFRSEIHGESLEFEENRRQGEDSDENRCQRVDVEENRRQSEELRRGVRGGGSIHEAKRSGGGGGGGGGESSGMRREYPPLSCSSSPPGGGDGTVGLVEVIVDDNNRVWHLVLELCACSLHDRIQRERGLCEREAALLIKSLAKVVQGLHRLGIVHRDLKPPNILLSRPAPPYDVKVADFGLSVAALGGKLDHIVGTTKYLAPEVVRDGRFDQAVDIWGLGLILYEALSGLTAFAGLESEFVLERLGWVDMPADMLDWSGVGLEAKELVLGMLCLDPKRRLTTQQIQVHPWVLKHTEEGFVPRTPSRIVKLKRLNGKWVSDRGSVQQQQQQRQQQHRQQQQQQQLHQQQQQQLHQQQRKRKKSEESTRSYRKLRLRCVNGAWQVVKPCTVAG